MLKRFNFFFSNEFQKFHIEAKVSEYDLIYKVHIAEGVLGVTTSNEWQIYSKDAVLWLKDFIDLRTFNWGNPTHIPRLMILTLLFFLNGH